ncbi:MAG: Ribosomal RNA small subunit methyltransferase H [Alphaproteobacteria bacterium MarineAlpha5_Bin6]|nr:MAG: Ribosomal RNA small subunit methyltransferase H [Alphaproteobacteria bacterium MarineAlpha5_Bin6]
MKNKHIPVMLNEVKSYIPSGKKINVIDATFGGGSYSKKILEDFNVGKLVAIDRDPITKIFSEELEKKFKNFSLINGCFSNLDELINNNQKIKKNEFDIIIFDLGVSSNQIDDPERGFSFTQNGPLDMRMDYDQKKASEIINNYSENELANIIYQYGEERFSRRIASNIVKARKIKLIETTFELVQLVKDSYGSKKLNKSKINPATKTFQAIRIYINDELNELKTALNKSIDLLKSKGKIIVVSFQSLEDRIVKDFFNHNSGKRWRSSRHYPELVDNGQINFKIITKKPIRPSEKEKLINPRSRSAKLRIAQKVN